VHDRLLWAPLGEQDVGEVVVRLGVVEPARDGFGVVLDGGLRVVALLGQVTELEMRLCVTRIQLDRTVELRLRLLRLAERHQRAAAVEVRLWILR
jgi:hypothetical protein